MPRLKRRGPGKLPPAVTPAARAFFREEVTAGNEHNWDAIELLDLKYRFREEWATRQWEAARHTVLEEWITTRPGTRPVAWWQHDAPPEPRRQVTGEPHRFPKNWMPYYDHGVPGDADPADYEAEADYLARHGLLTDAEREVLGR